jgi:hypothetical protein
MAGRMRSVFTFLFFVFNSSNIFAQDITPRPVKTMMGKGPGFEVTSSVRILFDKSFVQQAEYFASQVEKQCGMRLQTLPMADIKSIGKDFTLVFDSIKVTKDEMY